MKSTVTFVSDRFKPVLPEDSQVNPGRYGAELAYWFSVELAKDGVVTSYPNYEDWGWFIEFITEDGDEFWWCCGNVDGADNQWHCFLQPKSKRLFGRAKADVDMAQPLLEAIHVLLDREESVKDIRWSDS